MDDDSDSSYGWAIGFTAFAAMIMLLIGFYQMAMGLTAVLNQDFFVATPNYVFAFDVGTWGWVHLIWGVVVIAAALSLFSGATWARVLGSILAVLTAIEAFLFIPYQPFWSIVIIAASVMVIWALTTQIETDASPEV